MKSELRRVIAAGVLGNTLELYDFAVYGYFARILALNFFPTADPLSSLLATYGVFACGFVMRPLGAILIGYIGDRHGRKRALEISILLMLLPTLAIGLLPTHASIGLAAPLLLTACRMLQGVSVGGELTGSYAYLAEHAPEGQKGYVTSWTLVGAMTGKLLGVLVFLCLSWSFSEAALAAWGWRLAFLLGLAFGGAGYLLRRRLRESSALQEIQKKKQPSFPLVAAMRDYWLEMLQAVGITTAHTVGVYLLFVYMPVYLHTQCGIPQTQSMLSTAVALTCVSLILPVSGAWSDRIGKRPVLFWGALLLGASVYPCFLLMASGSVLHLFIAHALIATLFGFMHAPLPTVYVDLFPPEVRSTASGIAYNACILLFGGVSPFLCTLLIQQTGNDFAPAYWMGFAALLSCLSVASLRSQHQLQEVYA